MFFNENYKSLIQHVQKTGGESLYYSLGKHSPVGLKWLMKYGAHVTYTMLKNQNEQLFDEVKENWFKMSTVRNPWSHAVSRYFHFIDTKRIMKTRKTHSIEMYDNFEFYLEHDYDPQDVMTFNDDNFMVDKWLRLEEREKDWDYLCEINGFGNVELVHHNKTNNRKNYFNYVKPDNYRDMYTNDRSIELVFQKSKKTIENLGYNF